MKVQRRFYLSEALTLKSTPKCGSTYVAKSKICTGQLLLSECPVAYVCSRNTADSSGQPSAVKSSISQLATQVALLLQSDISFAADVDALCSNYSLRSGSDVDMLMAEARMMALAMGNVPLDVCARIIDKLLCNVFTVTDYEMKPLGAALYLRASKFNHSCLSNAVQTFSNSEIQIRASRDIVTGEEVTISYIDVGQPTLFRQHELQKSYFFWCQCTKCVAFAPYYGFNCFTKACPGLCNADNNISSLKYLAHLQRPLELRSNKVCLTWQHHLPYVHELEGLLLYILPNGLVRKNNSTQCEQISFSCHKCHRKVTLDEWIGKMNIVATHRIDTTPQLSWARKDVTLIRQAIPDSFYIVMESISNFVLKLIAQSNFAEACRYNILAIPCFRLLYPGLSTTLGIQLYQVAKLLQYLEDRRNAVKYLSEALKCLSSLYGDESELFRTAQQFALEN